MNAEESVSREAHVLHKYPTSPTRDKIASTDSEDTISENVPGKTHQVTVKFAIKKTTPKFKFNFERIRKLRKRPRAVQEHSYLEKNPSVITCPNCLYYIKTEVRYYNTCITHVLALSLLPICLCLVPYHTTTFKDAAHYCPKCEIYLGINFAAGKKFCPPWPCRKI